MTDNQLTLFGTDTVKNTAPLNKLSGGSHNPIVYNDYESFIAKFTEKPKTTDECWTPNDVYEAVVRYVGTVTNLTDKVILRPFYPGGDYINAEYPDNGVVIDNPPFSIFTKIVRFYTDNSIPFFLFGNGMTIGTAFRYCTAVIINNSVTFSNGAVIRINFASNLYGDMLAVTAPALDKAIKACPSQNTKVNLPIYNYPEELVSISDLMIIAKGGIEFSISRSEGVPVENIDNHPNRKLFGSHLLVTAAKAAAKAAIHVELSPREKNIINNLEQAH